MGGWELNSTQGTMNLQPNPISGLPRAALETAVVNVMVAKRMEVPMGRDSVEERWCKGKTGQAGKRVFQALERAGDCGWILSPSCAWEPYTSLLRFVPVIKPVQIQVDL